MRLGPTSAERSSLLAKASAGPYPESIELTCAQVPKDFDEGSPVWLWLGSDNNKGQATDWTQGIHALARCGGKTGPVLKQYEITLSEIYILPRTVEKSELLTHSPETYANSLIDAAIVGIYNYASQVVQILSDEEFATIGAIIGDLLPDAKADIEARVTGAADVVIVPRRDKIPEEGWTTVPPPPPLESEVAEDDPIFLRVRQLIETDGWGGVLLVGPPGTGKSWYARQIAIRLAEGDRTRVREVQFHPSYQYEDFVEGYVPSVEGGFALKGKHLIEMADVARRNEGRSVLVIDEFSRTDPARVLGEALTYMEGSLRDVDFFLPSGRKMSVPQNLIFLATMNPEDRSVDEIDSAMERRWAKVQLAPSQDKLRDFLLGNDAPNSMIYPVMTFFTEMQKHVEIGHAFFRTVSNAESLQRLWESQLLFLVRKRFRHEAETLAEITGLWEDCIRDVRTVIGAEPAPSSADA